MIEGQSVPRSWCQRLSDWWTGRSAKDYQALNDTDGDDLWPVIGVPVVDGANQPMCCRIPVPNCEDHEYLLTDGWKRGVVLLAGDCFTVESQGGRERYKICERIVTGDGRVLLPVKRFYGRLSVDNARVVPYPATCARFREAGWA